MQKINWERKKEFSFPRVLSGFLGVIFGEDFGSNLFKEEYWKKGSKVIFSADELLPEQTKILNLLAAAEIQKTSGSYAGLKKTCHLLLEIVRKCLPHHFNRKERDIFIRRLSCTLFIGMGDFLAGKSLPGEALNFYQEYGALFPGDPVAARKLARTYYTMGPNYLSEAESLYREILSARPEDLDTAENLGRILKVSPGGMDEARLVYRDALQHCRTDMDKLRFYSHLLELSPADGNILLRVGRLYQRLGMFMEARRYLEEASKVHDDDWATLDLAYLHYLLNNFRQAEVLLGSVRFGQDEAYYSSCYLLGMIKEAEERWEEAREHFAKIPAGSSYYWRACAGMARVFVYQGDYASAENLARSIPPGERAKLGADFLELGELLENVLQRESYTRANEWRDHVSESLPSFHLKKDVHKRSMGPNFWRKYEAVEVMGNGPAGQLLLGRDRHRGLQVAIKYLPADLLEDPLTVRRIQGLLRTLRQLNENDSYYVRVYEDCLYQGSFFYAMEYMERDLGSIIRSWAPAPTEIVTAIAVQICDALDWLYRFNGWSMHGAIKPENILISSGNEFKISDFDLLWALKGRKVFSLREIKRWPAFLRTFTYYAPERLKEKGFFEEMWSDRSTNEQSLERALEGVDHRADFYSLGVILFELATGFLPFTKHSVKGLLSFHKAKRSPNPTLLNPSINPDLNKIITTLMSRDPSRRFNTPGEIKEALQKIL